MPVALFGAGLLFPAALAPTQWWPLGMASIAVLAWHLGKSDRQLPYKSFTTALLWGLGMYLSGVSWVFVSINDFGVVPLPLTGLATALFCAFMAFIFALPFALLPTLYRATGKQPSLLWATTFAALWLLGEWLRSWLLTGFPWLYAGYMHSDNILAPWASLGGVYLLSFYSAFVAATLIYIKKLTRSAAALALAVVALPIIFANAWQQIHWTHADGQPLTVALIQPDIQQAAKWQPGQRRDILQQLVEQTRTYLGSDIIVWPEAAVPAIPQSVRGYLQQRHAESLQSDSALLIGIPNYDIANRDYYNSMLALGAASGQYDKTRLVPFAEYIPLEKSLGGLLELFQLPMESMAYGAENQPPMLAKGHPIATAICYEIVYPDLVGNNARDASLLLTVSNDAWFGDSLAPAQHMQMARLRAIENSKPLLRATNNGISAIVDHRGKVQKQLPQFIRGELTGHIQPRRGSTPFSIWGSTPLVVACLIFCAILGFRQRSLQGK